MALDLKRNCSDTALMLTQAKSPVLLATELIADLTLFPQGWPEEREQCFAELRKAIASGHPDELDEAIDAALLLLGYVCKCCREDMQGREGEYCSRNCWLDAEVV